jgi:hypothetical protein
MDGELPVGVNNPRTQESAERNEVLGELSNRPAHLSWSFSPVSRLCPS